MVFAKISQVAHYAPDQVVSNDDLAESWIQVMNGSVVGRYPSASHFKKMRRQVI